VENCRKISPKNSRNLANKILKKSNKFIEQNNENENILTLQDKIQLFKRRE
jgi:hypothetical protein